MSGSTLQRRPTARQLAQAVAEVRYLEREKRAHANDVRQTAWCHYNGQRPGVWPFWRHGFAAVFGKRVERSDFTAIPGYDSLAQEMAAIFPEYSDESGCERLWDFLLSPYEKIPPRADVVHEARRLLRDRRRQPAAEVCNDPF